MRSVLHYKSPLGAMQVVSDGKAIVACQFLAAKHVPVKRLKQTEADGPIKKAVAFLDAYFAGKKKLPAVPVALPDGTPFQRAVWEALRDIPRGGTCSYGEVSKAAGKPAAFRAAANAVGDNQLLILVPCHRVLRSNGGIGGFAGDAWRKEALLALERRG